MQVHQNLSILFYRKKKKADKNGYMPIYCRVTIDGIEDEISTGCKVLYDDWDSENKLVFSSHPNYKAFNKRIGQMKTDLERHFDLVVAKKGLATPKQVFESYKTPLNGHQEKKERIENAAFSFELNELINEAVVKYLRKRENIERKGELGFSQLQYFESKKEELIKKAEKLGERGRKIWENKEWTKTLVVAIDEYMFNFLELVLADQRARATFSKIITTKSRVVEFMQHYYKKDDMPLVTLEKKFMEQFVKYVMTCHQNSHNTVWKYVQIIKDIADRAFTTNSWMSVNVIASFNWSYKEPEDKDWPSMEQMLHLINFQFEEKDKELSDIRYIFIFQSFSGPSYAELHSLRPGDLGLGMDGETWTDQHRQKTKVAETIPLLPICLEILELFKNDPRCLRKGKCLYVPTNQHYNRCLKEIGDKTGIACLNNSHQARYFFSNEVLDSHGVDLNAIGIMLGQKDPKSVRTYVKPKKKMISTNMQMVKEKLYGEDGPLSKKVASSGGAKVVSINAFR